MNKIKKNVEIEGSTVEEAINNALKLLNVPREAILIKILCEEKKGLFVMKGANPAKIKVTLKDKFEFGKEKSESKRKFKL